MSTRAWLVPAVGAGVLTCVALVIGVWQLLCGKSMEAANWVMAAGGLGLIVFSCVQLYREARRDEERLAAARAKLKPAARLARRECEQGVIESTGKPMNQWLTRWYLPVQIKVTRGGPEPINILEERLRETVTLAAEASSADVRAADAALDAFILAADIINDLSRLLGSAETTVYQGAIPRAQKAVEHLAAAARALEQLAPRGSDEPIVPAKPRFPA